MSNSSISRRVFAGFAGITLMTLAVLALAIGLLMALGSNTQRMGTVLTPQSLRRCMPMS